MQDVIDFVSQLGLPVALVIIVIVAIYKLARYIAPLGRKVVQQHVIFLDATKMQQKRTVDAIEKQTDLLSGLTRTNKSLVHLADAAEKAIENEPAEAKRCLDRMRNLLTDE